jgi:hypothetical protein
VVADARDGGQDAEDDEQGYQADRDATTAPRWLIVIAGKAAEEATVPVGVGINATRG